MLCEKKIRVHLHSSASNDQSVFKAAGDENNNPWFKLATTRLSYDNARKIHSRGFFNVTLVFAIHPALSHTPQSHRHVAYVYVHRGG